MRNNVVNYLQRQGRGTEQFKFFSERGTDLHGSLRFVCANYRKVAKITVKLKLLEKSNKKSSENG